MSTLRIPFLKIWQTSNFTYGKRQIAYWSLLESTLGIIDCCLPITDPIISAATFSELWTRSNPSHGKASYGKGLSVKANSRGGQNLETGPFKRLSEPSYTRGPMPSNNHEILTSSNSTYFLIQETIKLSRSNMIRRLCRLSRVKQKWQVHATSPHLPSYVAQFRP